MFTDTLELDAKGQVPNSYESSTPRRERLSLYSLAPTWMRLTVRVTEVFNLVEKTGRLIKLVEEVRGGGKEGWEMGWMGWVGGKCSRKQSARGWLFGVIFGLKRSK